MDTTSKSVPFIETSPQNQKCKSIFLGFDHFSNYIGFAYEFLEPRIWVDNESAPDMACFYTEPAFFLWGDPDSRDVKSLFDLFTDDCWIVPDSGLWDQHLNLRFGSKLITHPRASFDSSSLNLDHLRSLKGNLPAGLQIVPIDESHINNQDGMLYEDLLCKYFTKADFLQNGRGFCLLEGQRIIGFAAANYPVRKNILEVYIRVDYNNDPVHRHQGLGTMLGAALLESCLENGIDPQWDAANDISIRLAEKLGYTLHHHWKMYHYQA